MEFRVKFLPNEYFFGGPTSKATDMPLYAGKKYEDDFLFNPRNQMTPVYISTKGRYIWSEHTFKVRIVLIGEDFQLNEKGNNLREAYLNAMNDHFPFEGNSLPSEFFTTAQYNTWMEFTYHPTQEGVLDYAHNIISHGFEPGILIIDEGWHGRYGYWQWDKAAFPNPKEMIKELHSLGFKVMLWIVPLVCPDGQDFIMNIFESFNPKTYDKLFLRNKEGKIALVNWWNGFSAILDFRKECDREFLDSKLQYLIDEYGVDGFKFDGGSYAMYHPDNLVNGTPREDHDPEALNKAWNEFGRKYTFHEYKDTFKGGGKIAIQRLCDRGHIWDNDGINTLLPCSIMQGLMGYPFICPDMIGGGEWSYTVKPGFVIDEELFIRMAQASALCPMMQFSWAPWRALSKEAYDIVAEAGQLHKKMANKIIALVRESEKTGEPILRSLEYNYPNNGYEEIMDEFMLGTDILVCPVVTKGTFKKEIAIPEGKWKLPNGEIIEGNIRKVFDTPIDSLLYFEKI